jgi:hypothetical protein
MIKGTVTDCVTRLVTNPNPAAANVDATTCHIRKPHRITSTCRPSSNTRYVQSAGNSGRLTGRGRTQTGGLLDIQHGGFREVLTDSCNTLILPRPCFRMRPGVPQGYVKIALCVASVADCEEL